MTRRTVLKGPFVMAQDITKSEGVWHPNELPADGDQFWYDGSDALIGSTLGNWEASTYETRDDRRVLRIPHNGIVGVAPGGSLRYRHDRGEAVSILAYYDDAGIDCYFEDPTLTQALMLLFDLKSPGFEAGVGWGSVKYPTGADYVTPTPDGFNIDAWTPGWYRMDMRWDWDQGFSWRIYPEDSPIDWIKVQPDNFKMQMWFAGCVPQIYVYVNAGGVFDLYEWGWSLT